MFRDILIIFKIFYSLIYFYLPDLSLFKFNYKRESLCVVTYDIIPYFLRTHNFNNSYPISHFSFRDIILNLLLLQQCHGIRKQPTASNILHAFRVTTSKKNIKNSLSRIRFQNKKSFNFQNNSLELCKQYIMLHHSMDGQSFATTLEILCYPQSRNFTPIWQALISTMFG